MSDCLRATLDYLRLNAKHLSRRKSQRLRRFCGCDLMLNQLVDDKRLFEFSSTQRNNLLVHSDIFTDEQQDLVF